MRAAVLTLITAAGLSGCGLLYDIGQDKALQNCERAYSAADRQACRKANSQSYEDYEKRRQAAKEGKAP
ncbi:hypothetical protein [Roseateles sp.]|uniref:hypothetical protein n=1 Tax=Roseateles sp. TaxID=1971397 RepID=UPI002E0AA1ED|nr:hypothetical protein [Roseateles sp.]